MAVGLLLVALTLVFAVIRPALKKEEPPEPEAKPDAALDAVVDDAEALPDPTATALPPNFATTYLIGFAKLGSAYRATSSFSMFT
jgi:hypothetical protein